LAETITALPQGMWKQQSIDLTLALKLKKHLGLKTNHFNLSIPGASDQLQPDVCGLPFPD
jgi:hypothetical protein